MTSQHTTSFWHDPKKRSLIFQLFVLVLILIAGTLLFTNTQKNLARQSIATGFGFLDQEASFDISESLIPHSATNTYAHAFVVGILNTLKVAFLGIFLSTILGTFFGIARLSTNWLVKKGAGFTIEVLRNTPLLLQLFFWYAILTEVLPHPRDALNPIASIFLSNRGLHIGGELKGFNFEGGFTLSPEFIALLVGLVLYSSAFVAEIVRAGIGSVDKGQIEAAKTLGLKPNHILKLVVLPQALRVIIPPLTGQMLNLTKNSSLALAIGYPDIVSVANTTINQTGQAIEGIALIMAVYLFFSLLTSALMNLYNKKTMLKYA